MSFLLRHLRRVPPLLTGFARSLLPCTRQSLTQMDLSSESLVIGGHFVHLQEESGLAQDRRLVTIDMLPNDVLVEIFDFCAYVDDREWYNRQNTWHALVHVCRRWRYVVFASPRRLNLRLVYHGHRPISEVLGAWPVLPISLLSRTVQLFDREWDHTVAALESEHSNRISEIYVEMSYSHWERLAAAMQKPFPELTHLEIWAIDEVRVLPDSFLGGSAPRLRSLYLERIPFPSIPKLLLSAHGLVTLTLWEIPESGYISPDAIATSLAVMTRLEILQLDFDSPRSRPNTESRSLPPPTRSVLPSLTHLIFKGVYEYLEDLLARIDPPRLYHLYIEFFMDLDFDVPQLRRLIGHGEGFKTFDRAKISISDDSIQLHLYPSTVAGDDPADLKLQISCQRLDYQLSSLAQLCSSSFPFISALEELEIWEDDSLSDSLSSLHWKDDMDDAQWLELLDSFTSLKNLYLTDVIAQPFCGALQELSGERATEVLPALHSLFVRESSLESVQEAIRAFVAARQLSGHPLVVDRWKD